MNRANYHYLLGGLVSEITLLIITGLVSVLTDGLARVP